jgi:hypothetical protein
VITNSLIQTHYTLDRHILDDLDLSHSLGEEKFKMSVIFMLWNEMMMPGSNVSSLRIHLLSLRTLQLSQWWATWVRPERWGRSNGIEPVDVILPKTSSAPLTFPGEIWINKVFRPFKVDDRQCGNRGFSKTPTISVPISLPSRDQKRGIVTSGRPHKTKVHD